MLISCLLDDLEWKRFNQTLYSAPSGNCTHLACSGTRDSSPKECRGECWCDSLPSRHYALTLSPHFIPQPAANLCGDKRINSARPFPKIDACARKKVINRTIRRCPSMTRISTTPLALSACPIRVFVEAVIRATHKTLEILASKLRNDESSLPLRLPAERKVAIAGAVQGGLRCKLR